jgi:two-component system chemotaxis response regulator CheB
MTRQLINATCPECRGPLTEMQDGEMVEYECLVGHRYTPHALLHSHAQTQERALWAAVVALEEAESLVDAVAPHVQQSVRSLLESEAAQKMDQARVIRDLLHDLTPFRTE